MRMDLASCTEKVLPLRRSSDRSEPLKNFVTRYWKSRPLILPEPFPTWRMMLGWEMIWQKTISSTIPSRSILSGMFARS